MATYTVAANDNGIGAWNLTASQVDTVTFTGNIKRARIISDGAAEAVYTFDGSTPTMPAAGASTATMRLPVGYESVVEVPMDADSDTIKLLSLGAPRVSVEKAF